MKQRLYEIRKCVYENRPLIHCITNPISIHQCANSVLAVGARPIMAEHPEEVRDITHTANALMLNLGNITDVRMQSMLLSARTAKEKGIPAVLDAVGVACSGLRRKFVRELLSEMTPSIVKGNYSEILALCNAQYHAEGVDADALLDPKDVEQATVTLAQKLGSTVLASGKQDIITDGRTIVKVNNGTSKLSLITGTGCMLGALCAAYLTAGTPIDASVAACTVLGICGQIASTDRGTGTFMVNLMDALSTLQDADIENKISMEVNAIEEP